MKTDKPKFVTVRYVNPHIPFAGGLGVQCEIEIPVTAKTKAAVLDLGGGARMGLSELAGGSVMRSAWSPA